MSADDWDVLGIAAVAWETDSATERTGGTCQDNEQL